jgi:hypothetical protein
MALTVTIPSARSQSCADISRTSWFLSYILMISSSSSFFKSLFIRSQIKRFFASPNFFHCPPFEKFGRNDYRNSLSSHKQPPVCRFILLLYASIVSFHPEMALFRNICVNLLVCLFPHPASGTRNPLTSLILRKIAHF